MLFRVFDRDGLPFADLQAESANRVAREIHEKMPCRNGQSPRYFSDVYPFKETEWSLLHIEDQ
jgi:hypothetical protein